MNRTCGQAQPRGQTSKVRLSESKGSQYAPLPVPEVVGRSRLVKVIGHVLVLVLVLNLNKDWQHPVGEVELEMLGYAYGLRIGET